MCLFTMRFQLWAYRIHNTDSAVDSPIHLTDSHPQKKQKKTARRRKGVPNSETTFVSLQITKPERAKSRISYK